MNQQPTIDEADATERSRIIAMIAAGPIGQDRGKKPKGRGCSRTGPGHRQASCAGVRDPFVKTASDTSQQTTDDMEIWRRAVAVWVQEKMPRIRKSWSRTLRGPRTALTTCASRPTVLAYEAFEAMRKDRRLKFEGCFWSLMESWKWSTLKNRFSTASPLNGSLKTFQPPPRRRRQSAGGRTPT